MFLDFQGRPVLSIQRLAGGGREPGGLHPRNNQIRRDGSGLKTRTPRARLSVLQVHIYLFLKAVSLPNPT